MPFAVAGRSVSGSWVRQAPRGADPLALPRDPADGRWQRGATVRALYLADERATADAEWFRLLAERGLPPEQAIPYDVHVWAVDVTVADLSADETLDGLGLTTPLRPSRRSWPPCQTTGEQLWREGWRGLIAPSAARPTGLVLCLFGEERPPTGTRLVRTQAQTSVPVPPTGMTT